MRGRAGRQPAASHGTREADGHHVYLPQRDTPALDCAGRTTALFLANFAALSNADALVAVCDGAHVDDGTAWEIGCAWALNMRVFGIRTGRRIAKQPDERINLT
jgi:nucleoside 2-deoxyribosyltransferase